MTNPDLTPEAVERLKDEVMMLEHNGGFWVTAEDYAALSAALAEMTRRRDHWKALAEGQDFTRIYLETCAERDALQAKCDEMAAALDSKHASVGYNIWRFWSDKSRELAAKNVALQAKLAEATATVELLEAHLEVVKEIYPPVPGAIRTAMEARAAKKGQANE